MKALRIIAATSLALTLAGCSATDKSSTVEQKTAASQQQTGTEHQAETIKASPDKYTWYVKDYRGMNAASIGYTALDEQRRDQYGKGLLKVVYVSAEGSFIDPTNEDTLKQYVVYDQSLKPNTEIKLTFQKQEDGTEYDNLIDVQSQEEIVLAVKKISEGDATAPCMTSIEPSPDKYNRYVRDYVGRNLAVCGYTALSGSLADQYGHGYLVINVAADDGSFIDPEDEESLSQYLVVSQSVAPNTPITMEFAKKTDGTEYDNLVSSQSMQTIDVKVTKLA